jgi:hypothetical protein
VRLLDPALCRNMDENDMIRPSTYLRARKGVSCCSWNDCESTLSQLIILAPKCGVILWRSRHEGDGEACSLARQAALKI